MSGKYSGLYRPSTRSCRPNEIHSVDTQQIPSLLVAQSARLNRTFPRRTSRRSRKPDWLPRLPRSVITQLPAPPTPVPCPQKPGGPAARSAESTSPETTAAPPPLPPSQRSPRPCPGSPRPRQRRRSTPPRSLRHGREAFRRCREAFRHAPEASAAPIVAVPAVKWPPRWCPKLQPRAGGLISRAGGLQTRTGSSRRASEAPIRAFRALFPRRYDVATAGAGMCAMKSRAIRGSY